MKDTEFIRGNVPMTKEEIRTIVISKLNLCPTDTLMDIGAGTGSVSIEAAKILTHGKVIAIEQKTEAFDLIKQNAQKHNISNINIIHSKAPQGMEELHNTNKFFIGGSGGNLTEVLEIIKNQATQNATIVVTAIVLDTMIQAYQFFTTNNYLLDFIQVSVNKIDPSMSASMLMAQNPIFILTAKRK